MFATIGTASTLLLLGSMGGTKISKNPYVGIGVGAISGLIGGIGMYKIKDSFYGKNFDNSMKNTKYVLRSDYNDKTNNDSVSRDKQNNTWYDRDNQNNTWYDRDNKMVDRIKKHTVVKY